MSLLICPNCKTGMKAVVRHGVEVDVCPDCQGVWLDRGELDKILEAERARQAAPETASFLPRDMQQGGITPPAYNRPRHDDDDDHEHGHGNRPWGQHRDDEHDARHGKPRGWQSMLDIFD